jgi:hypothetical protein
MGVSVHRTYRVKHVEGRRDEIHTVKTNWSAAQCGEDQRKPRRHEPAGLATSNRCRYLFSRLAWAALMVSLSDRSVPAYGLPALLDRTLSSPQNMLACADAKCTHSTRNHHNHTEDGHELRRGTRST